MITNRLIAVLSVFLIAGGSVCKAQTIPQDPNEFAIYYAGQIAIHISDQKAAPSNGKVTLSNAAGAKLVINADFLLSGCEHSAQFESCVHSQIDNELHFLKPPNPAELRARLTRWYGPGAWGLNIIPDAVPWKRHAFGIFQVDCKKGAPDYAFPFTSWDGVILNRSEQAVGEICEADTRKALGTLPEMTADSDGVVTLHGPDEASRLLFLDEWRELAASEPVLVAAPNSDTLLIAKGNSNQTVTNLSARARRSMAEAQPYDQLSADVFRWTASGWALITDHAVADKVAAAINNLEPGHALVIDRGLIALAGSSEGSELNIQPLVQSCDTQAESCDAMIADFVNKQLGRKNN